MPRQRAMLLCILVLVAAGCGSGGAGPLGVPDNGWSSIGGPVPVGHFLTFGIFPPANKSGDDAILESLEPDDPASAQGLELRYAVVRLPDPRCQVGSFPGWPPRQCPAGHLNAINGFRYPDGKRAEILVGARSSRPGIWWIHAFRLRYHVAGHHYSAVYRQGAEVHSNPTFAFQTSAHDVRCQVDERERLLECQLSAGAITPNPPSCYSYRLVGYSLKPAGRAEIMCGRRGFIPAHTMLRAALRRSGFACTLRAAGVRCRNRTGHGFFVSRGHSYKF